MTPLLIAAYRAHAMQAQFKRRVAEMQSVIAGVDPARSYVSFSAGKDSAVVAHACHEAHPGIPILMIDPGCPTHWTEDERARWLAYAAANAWNLTLYPWDKWGSIRDSGTMNLELYRARIHRNMFGAIRARAERDGLDCRIMGLRAEESHARRMLVRVRGAEYRYVDGGECVLPIARWRTPDVWAYIVTRGLPWLDIYDKLGPQARNGFIGRNGLRYGREEYLREYFPDVWRWAAKNRLFNPPVEEPDA